MFPFAKTREANNVSRQFADFIARRDTLIEINLTSRFSSHRNLHRMLWWWLRTHKPTPEHSLCDRPAFYSQIKLKRRKEAETIYLQRNSFQHDGPRRGCSRVG